MTDKSTIRRMIRKVKTDLTPYYIASASHAIIKRLEQHPRFQSADRICIYHALPDEVQTQALINTWCCDKTIYLPVIRQDKIYLSLYQPHDALVAGKYGIGEPAADHLLTAYDTLDLIILPGMAFDSQGTRLGRGRGYFDTLLSHPQFAGVYKIGICFDFQKFTKLPHEPHDVRVDEVI